MEALMHLGTESIPVQPSFPNILPHSVKRPDGRNQAAPSHSQALHLPWASQDGASSSKFTRLGHRGRGASGNGDGELIKVVGKDGCSRCVQYCPSRNLGSVCATASVTDAQVIMKFSSSSW